MANIYATRRELATSFKKNYYAYQHINSSAGVAQQFIYPSRLLLFYAVECGLKSMILKREKLDTSDDLFKIGPLGDKLKDKGHDIEEMLKYLKAGHYILPEIFFKGRTSALPYKYNQIWRYGVQSDTKKDPENKETQDRVEQELAEIAKWIEGEI